jgi:hypothetical protein
MKYVDKLAENYDEFDAMSNKQSEKYPEEIELSEFQKNLSENGLSEDESLLVMLYFARLAKQMDRIPVNLVPKSISKIQEKLDNISELVMESYTRPTEVPIEYAHLTDIAEHVIKEAATILFK